jgi:Rieske Fe-S protein
MEENGPRKISRRDFVNYLLSAVGAALGAAIVYPVVKFIIPPEIPEATPSSVVAANLDDMPANSGKVFRFGKNVGILIRSASGDFKAFSATCTHLSCTVQYRSDLAQIWCACHNGHYDLNGKNVSGPPPRPLKEFSVFIRGKDVIVAEKKA